MSWLRPPGPTETAGADHERPAATNRSPRLRFVGG